MDALERKEEMFSWRKIFAARNTPAANMARASDPTSGQIDEVGQAGRLGFVACAQRSGISVRCGTKAAPESMLMLSFRPTSTTTEPSPLRPRPSRGSQDTPHMLSHN